METVDRSFFFVSRAAIKPLENLPSENGFLFIFKVSGEMKVSGVGLERYISEGRAAAFSAERLKSIADEGATVYFVVGGRFFEELCSLYSLTDGTVVCAPDCSEDFFAICRSFEKGDLAEQSYLIHKILYKMSQAFLDVPSAKADTPRLIKEYIDCHSKEKLTLDEISQVFFLSKSQIFRIFKSKYGVSPMQYYIEKKLDHAKQMLVSTDMRVSDIADALGFSDAKHLSKTFLKLNGILPKNYRKQHKGK